MGPDFHAVTPVPFGRLIAPPERAQAQPAGGGRAFLARVNRRRFACLREADAALDVLPDEGAELHLLMTGTYDLMHLLIAMLARLGSRCEAMGVATLALSRRNVQEMAALLSDGKVRRIDVLVSHFFARHDQEIFAELLHEAGRRGQRVAVARCHAKIVTVALEDNRRYTLTGSANLRTNKNIEQMAITRDPALHRHYDAWLSTMMDAHEVRPSNDPATS